MPAEPRLVSRISGLIHETLNVEVLSPDADLIETGLLDSLALVTLLVELEEDFACELPLDDFDLDQFRTVRRIADFLASLGAPGGTGLDSGITALTAGGAP